MTTRVNPLMMRPLIISIPDYFDSPSGDEASNNQLS